MERLSMTRHTRLKYTKSLFVAELVGSVRHVMSVIFGVRPPDGAIVNEELLGSMGRTSKRHAADGVTIQRDRHVGMGFGAFHTHARSTMESQPAVDTQGNILVFDGRLDNFEELAELQGAEKSASSDSALVLKAFAIGR
jgi:asparagine synthetase B (glutamine-hydrolysing)